MVARYCELIHERFVALDPRLEVFSRSAAAVALSGVVEFSKIKLNPWSWLAKHIGRAINGEVLDKMDALNERVDKLSGKVDQSEARQDERDARTARTHILRFGDEVRIGTRHSKESFDEVLADITAYETYFSTRVSSTRNSSMTIPSKDTCQERKSL